MYTSWRTRKRMRLAAAANDNYPPRGTPCTWPEQTGDWLTSKSVRIAKQEPEEAADWEVWIGARKYVAANDNRSSSVVKQPNDGPDEDHLARLANPGTTRGYDGDVFSRLAADGNHEAYLALRSIGAVLSPVGLLAANDVGAEDADVEVGDGFGMDYVHSEDDGDTALARYLETGKLPSGVLRFRQRSGNPSGKLTAEHRKAEKEGLHVDRYLGLRGVAELPPQQYHSDGERPWWRSLAQKNSSNTAELAAACDRTDFRRVTWTRYASLPARVYGALGIYSEMKGTGAGKTQAPSHGALHELHRRAAEGDLRSRVSERSMRIVDAALARSGYTAIGTAESLSRNGAKKAVLAAIREAWSALADITEEKTPTAKKVAA